MNIIAIPTEISWLSHKVKIMRQTIDKTNKDNVFLGPVKNVIIRPVFQFGKKPMVHLSNRLTWMTPSVSQTNRRLPSAAHLEMRTNITPVCPGLFYFSDLAVHKIVFYLCCSCENISSGKEKEVQAYLVWSSVCWLSQTHRSFSI